MSDIKKNLAKIWANAFSTSIEFVNSDCNLIEMGADSITVSKIYSDILETYLIEIPLEDLIENPTFGNLCKITEIELKKLS